MVSFPPLSRGRLLFVRLREKGDFIDLGIPPFVEPGKYLLKARLVTSWDYAVVRVEFNGTPMGQPVDTYSPRIGARSVVLGDVEVRPGRNILRVEAVGRNPASAGHYAGIDAVMLVPIE